MDALTGGPGGLERLSVARLLTGKPVHRGRGILVLPPTGIQIGLSRGQISIRSGHGLINGGQLRFQGCFFGLHLGYFRCHFPVPFFQLRPGRRQLPGLVGQPAGGLAEMGQVVFQLINGPLGLHPVPFFPGDLLVLPGPLQPDRFGGRFRLPEGCGHRRLLVSEGVQLLGGRGQSGRGVIIPADGEPEIDVPGSILIPLVTLGLAGLALEAPHLPLHLGDNVGDPKEVLVGGVELSEGFGFPVLVPGDPGGFLDENPPLLGTRLGDGPDVSLADHRVRPASHPAAQKDVVDVLEPAGPLVEKIDALPGPVKAAGDHDLGEVPEGLRPRAVVVVEDQGDFGHVDRRPAAGPGEDHVLHRLAPELLDTLLPHGPSERVNDVTLAAAVWADNGRNARGKVDGGLFHKRLEPGDLHPFELHIPLIHSQWIVNRASGETSEVSKVLETSDGYPERSGRLPVP